MTEAPQTPALSPQFCFSPGALREFLRLSRASIDDTITQNLNALVTPASAGFDPTSTSQRTASASRQVDPGACQSFKDEVLFPAWEARKNALVYCGMVASSPDPDDPDASIIAAERQRDRERVVNERLDPYSSRFFPKEPRTEMLAALVRQQNSVETIVRSRTWDTVQQRCGGPQQDWDHALDAWRSK
ncbi:hypothetical protein N3K66_005982 [Trichothecium roseum]|uniref:Uncharacterized protein n=1 Tax=Trichothecium roseum TaxID=47278 RepID=A0ACC0UZQ3_9HYPO|nr:hypothetical protein N3K66_005982 [Trichothecium roseum]